jgi:hypothetical protein
MPSAVVWGRGGAGALAAVILASAATANSAVQQQCDDRPVTLPVTWQVVGVLTALLLVVVLLVTRTAVHGSSIAVGVGATCIAGTTAILLGHTQMWADAASCHPRTAPLALYARTQPFQMACLVVVVAAGAGAPLAALVLAAACHNPDMDRRLYFALGAPLLLAWAAAAVATAAAHGRVPVGRVYACTGCPDHSLPLDVTAGVLVPVGLGLGALARAWWTVQHARAMGVLVRVHTGLGMLSVWSAGIAAATLTSVLDATTLLAVLVCSMATVHRCRVLHNLSWSHPAAYAAVAWSEHATSGVIYVTTAAIFGVAIGVRPAHTGPVHTGAAALFFLTTGHIVSVLSAWLCTTIRTYHVIGASLEALRWSAVCLALACDIVAMATDQPLVGFLWIPLTAGGAIHAVRVAARHCASPPVAAQPHEPTDDADV